MASKTGAIVIINKKDKILGKDLPVVKMINVEKSIYEKYLMLKPINYVIYGGGGFAIFIILSILIFCAVKKCGRRKQSKNVKKEPISAELTRNDQLDLNVIRDLTKPELSVDDTN